MRFIHCTQKLIKEIDPKINSKGEERAVKGFGDWYANIFGVDQQAMIIFTNVKTLYTFIFPNVFKDNLEYFADTFELGLKRSLIEIGLNDELILRIINEYQEIAVVKTNSRSILATMNDHLNHFDGYLENKREITQDMVDRFNVNILDLPSGAMNYMTPKEKFKEILNTDFK